MGMMFQMKQIGEGHINGHDGKWTCQRFGENLSKHRNGMEQNMLHKDGTWQWTAYDDKTGEPSGFFDTIEEIAKLMSGSNFVEPVKLFPCQCQGRWITDCLLIDQSIDNRTVYSTPSKCPICNGTGYLDEPFPELHTIRITWPSSMDNKTCIMLIKGMRSVCPDAFFRINNMLYRPISGKRYKYEPYNLSGPVVD